MSPHVTERCDMIHTIDYLKLTAESFHHHVAGTNLLFAACSLTQCSISWGILLIVSLIIAFNSPRVRGFIAYTLSLKYGHKKKSSDVRSADRGGHNDLDTIRSPKSRLSSFMLYHEVWLVAPSCISAPFTQMIRFPTVIVFSVRELFRVLK